MLSSAVQSAAPRVQTGEERVKDLLPRPPAKKAAEPWATSWRFWWQVRLTNGFAVSVVEMSKVIVSPKRTLAVAVVVVVDAAGPVTSTGELIDDEDALLRPAPLLATAAPTETRAATSE